MNGSKTMAAPIRPAHETEEFFGPGELFFSVTDREGRIVFGNDVFIRISGFQRGEILGAPHNIVRHPDMPKTVFALLWRTIQEGKPLVAYVKNRTKTGRYYWVLAAVFPQDDRYISIRIKPTGSSLSQVDALYRQIVREEAEHGLDAGDALLRHAIAMSGFDGYESFMSHALLTEMHMREAYANGPSGGTAAADNGWLRDLDARMERLKGAYNRLFERVSELDRAKTLLAQSSGMMRLIGRDTLFLSLNASIASAKIERNGATFGVLAEQIRANVKENDRLIAVAETMIDQLYRRLTDAVFAIGSMRLQMAMAQYFVHEQSRHGTDEEVSAENIRRLVRLTGTYAQRLDAALRDVGRLLVQLTQKIGQLETQMMFLDYVQVYGVIEASCRGSEGDRFIVIFGDLKGFVGRATQEIGTMGTHADSLGRGIGKMQNDVTAILGGLEQILAILAKEGIG